MKPGTKWRKMDQERFDLIKSLTKAKMKTRMITKVVQEGTGYPIGQVTVDYIRKSDSLDQYREMVTRVNAEHLKRKKDRQLSNVEVAPTETYVKEEEIKPAQDRVEASRNVLSSMKELTLAVQENTARMDQLIDALNNAVIPMAERATTDPKAEAQDFKIVERRKWPLHDLLWRITHKHA